MKECMKPRLALILLIFFGVNNFSQPLHSVHAQNLESQAAGDQAAGLRFWRDGSGDLWVKTPFYVWNITGSGQIQAGDLRPWVSEGLSGGDTFLDELFLAPVPEEAALSAKVIFALPTEGMVYLERAAEGGTEGLALTFRADDGLITLSRHWQGGPAPEVSLPDFKAVMQRGALPGKSHERAPEGFDYAVYHDPYSRRGVALLQPRGEQASLQAALPECYSKAGVSHSPEAAAHCQYPENLPRGMALGRQYLLLFEAEPGSVLAPLEKLAAQLELALPDLNVASIGRSPRYDYDQSQNQPLPGERVAFSGRVANRGSADTGRFSYEWRIDGERVSSGAFPNLAPGEMVEISMDWVWQSGAHTVSLALDPEDLVREVSQANNRVEDRTDALALGLWVEQSVYDWFNLHQVELGLGGVSWDDWAQRQVRVWNQMFAQTVYPLTPQGVLDRVRLDKVVVVPDGSLPGDYPSNFPAIGDKTVDLQWGFPCELVGECERRAAQNAYYLASPEALNIEYSLIHELSHARYLDDLYGLNVASDVVYLTDGVDEAGATLNVNQAVEGIQLFTPPIYLAAAGELVICMNTSGSSFIDCERGAQGTRARPHPAGRAVNRATVRLQDGQGNLVMGSKAMPLIGWNDHLYYNRYPLDVMSGGVVYQEHSAYALNRIAGLRPVCGNYNSPCNLGEYQNDVPEQNVLAVKKNGLPASGASVEVYRARQFPYAYYGKIFHGPPDRVLTGDERGEVELGAFPFSSDASQSNAWNRVLLLKITYQGLSSYQFFDITQTNLAYWMGQRARGIYAIEIPTTEAVDGWVAAPQVVAAGPGGQAAVQVDYGNRGLTKPEGATLTARYDPSLTAGEFSLPPALHTPGEITWNLGNLAGMYSGSLRASFTLPRGAYGDQYAVRWEITAGGEEAGPDNNLAETTLTIARLLSLPVIVR